MGQPVSVILGRRKPGSTWLSSDTLAALAWQSYLDGLCPGCGHPRDESMAREHQNDYEATSLRCFGCKAVAEGSEAMRKQAGDQPMPGGIYWSARLTG